MSLKKYIGYIHLWLGFITGPIICIVGLTGAIFVFRDEIETAQGVNNIVKIQIPQTPLLAPSKLKAICEMESPKYFAATVEYPSNQYQAAIVMMEDSAGWWGGYTINQYTGTILKKIKPGSFNFFDWCIEGHRWLWLPSYEVGHSIVNYATLLFVVSLLTGLVLWWPRNKAAAKQRFRFQWKPTTKWRRKNYDLHNVLGFYGLLIALILAITALIIGTEWFAKGFYYISSGGQALTEEPVLHSDTTFMNINHHKSAEDLVWQKLTQSYKGKGIYLQFAERNNNKSAISATIDNTPHHFDRYTLQEIKIDHPMYVKFEEAPVAAQLRRVNYEIHVGAIGGLATKVLAFFSSLIVASLPITGFYIWWGRRKKEKKR